ncbi:MAG: thioredoxin domain-containing protein [Candidatus Buchananbacteria bacterium]|nr:thioredoxin domain-containing protein [Candidatus Buchananbacteria bacterium]
MELDNNQQPDQIVRPKKNVSWYKKWWGVLILIFLMIFLILLVAFGFFIFSLVKQISSGSSNNITQGDINSIITLDDPTYGPRDAKVIFVEFGDFQCPACAESYPVVKQLMNNYGDRVLFIFKDFPLIQLHSQAALAALAGQCAKEQGNFWPMHDKMYQNNTALSETNLKTYALQLGLNGLQFGSCMSSAKYLDSIQSDFDLGIKLGIDLTPTFLINHNIIRGTAPLTEFEKIIVAELNK